MVFVPFGIRFTYNHEFENMEEVKGGSPYGSRAWLLLAYFVCLAQRKLIDLKQSLPPGQ